MRDAEITRVISSVRAAVRSLGEPYVSRLGRSRRDPFRTLVSCIISLRTKDEVTEAASRRLFALARTPRAMARLREKDVWRAIYPAGFYRTKAAQIVEIARRISEEHGGKVPDSVEELLTFRGVGRKTANLVVSVGFGKDAICVDTHVHRVMNRLGYVRTRTPAETERALREKLPRRYWREINPLLVAFGRTICRPVSPLCSRCPVEDRCGKVGVGRHR